MSTHNICFYGEIRKNVCLDAPYLELCRNACWQSSLLFDTCNKKIIDSPSK